MAGITDSAFRQVCISFGADLVYTEMVSADGLVYGSSKTLDLAKCDKKERPIILQLFGKKPESFVGAISDFRFQISDYDGIDINMGCPSRKVVNSGHGVALMRDVKLASEIVRKLKESLVAGQTFAQLPVSVKTRLGYKNKNEILKFGPAMEKAGADALCVHGRTYKQGFSGPIDFEILKKLKSKIKIPLIVSGGVYSPEDAKKVLEATGADGIMVGRGSYGRPWIFKEIKEEGIRGHKRAGKARGQEGEVTWAQIKKIALKHVALAYKSKGGHGIIEMRKHLAWYVRGRDGASELRRRLVRVETVEDIRNILKV